MSYTIRPMEPGDVSAIVTIERRSFPSPWPASAFSRELQRKHSSYYVLVKPEVDEPPSPKQNFLQWLRHKFTSVVKNHIIGYVGFRLEEGKAHITTIAIHPEWRGKKLGELLLLTAIEKAIKKKAHTVTLEMRPSNRIAHRLYCKYGFQTRETRRNYYQDGENALAMAVEINANGYHERLRELNHKLEAYFHRQFDTKPTAQTPQAHSRQLTNAPRD